MVAQLIRLKLTLLRNGFRRSTWQLVAVILGGLYALGLVLGLGVGMWMSADLDVELRQILTVLLGAVVTLGWAVIPVLLTGIDLTLEPNRFVAFGLPDRTLATGLLLSSFISIPALATLLALLSTGGVWRMQPALIPVALLCALGTAATALGLCQWVSAAASGLRGRRRFREISAGILLILLIFSGPLIQSITSATLNVRQWAEPIVHVLGYTPLAAFSAVPGFMAAGDFAGGGLRFALGCAYLGGLYWQIVASVAAARFSGEAAPAKTKSVGLGFFARMPAAPWGVVAARCLTYWFKDPRYAMAIVVVPLLPAVLWFSGRSSSDFTVFYVLGPVIAILLGFSISADVSYDHTAFSLHVLTGVSGRDDRIGRALACGLISILPVAAAGVLPGALLGAPERIVVDLGLSLSALLAALAVSSVVSARYVYSVPLPNGNPLKTPPGNGPRVVLTQLATFGIMLVLMSPLLIPYFIALKTGSTAAGWTTLLAGVIYGLVLLMIGIRIGGRWMDRRLPELLQAVMLNK